MCYSIRATPESIAGKKPRQEIHRRDGHADAEEHTGQDALRATFTEGEGEAGDDNGDKRESASDGAREGLLQHANGGFPRGIPLLGEGRSREEKGETDGD